jgi:hypothetical protein
MAAESISGRIIGLTAELVPDLYQAADGRAAWSLTQWWTALGSSHRCCHDAIRLHSPKVAAG